MAELRCIGFDNHATFFIALLSKYAAPGVRLSSAMCGRSASVAVKGCRHDDILVVRNAKGLPVWCPATAIELMKKHEDWQGCLHYDAFLQRDMLYRPVPGTDENENFEICEVRDTDVVQDQVWFNRNGFPDATRSTVADHFLGGGSEPKNERRRISADFACSGTAALTARSPRWAQDNNDEAKRWNLNCPPSINV